MFNDREGLVTLLDAVNAVKIAFKFQIFVLDIFA